MVITVSFLLAIKGIKESTNVVIAITLIEITGLLLICAAGSDNLLEKKLMVTEIFHELSRSNMTPLKVSVTYFKLNERV